MTPTLEAIARKAADILSAIRSGTHPYDIRKAGEVLDGRYDQDFIVGLLEAAAIKDLVVDEELAGKRREETGWLIEDMREPKWWTGHPGYATDDDFWTKESLKAVRFSRREDAEALGSYFFDGECRITEHMWTGPRP